MSTGSSRLTFYKLNNLFHISSQSRVLTVSGPAWVMCPTLTPSRIVHSLFRPGSHAHFWGQVSMTQMVCIERKGHTGDLPNKNQDDDTRRRRSICQANIPVSPINVL